MDNTPAIDRHKSQNVFRVIVVDFCNEVEWVEILEDYKVY